MANTLIEFDYYEGATLTVDTYPLKSDTADATADTATEQTNRKGKYRITVTEALTGIKEIRVKEGGVVVAVYWTEPLVDDTSVYLADDRRVDVMYVSGDSTAADNLELQYDTTGLTGDTFPATQLALAAAKTVVDAIKVVTDIMALSYKSSTVNDAGASTTVFITALTEATDDHYANSAIVFTSGALLNQVRKISAYNGTTKTITLSAALTDAPANGVSFIIIGRLTGT